MLSEPENAVNWSKKQSEKSVRLELGWFEPRKCWKKYKDGKMYYFKQPNSRAGYEAALLDWSRKLHELNRDRPHASEYQHHRNELGKCLKWYEVYGVPDGEGNVWRHLEELLKNIDAAEKELDLVPIAEFIQGSHRVGENVDRSQNDFINAFWTDDFGTSSYSLPSLWRERLRQFAEIEPAKRHKRPQTVKYWAEDFLSILQAKAAADQRSDVTYTSARQKLRLFREFMGDGSLISAFSSDDWQKFYLHLLKLKIRPPTQRGYRNAARTFIKYCWRNDDCDLERLPKNLDDRGLDFLRVHDDDDETYEHFIWTPAELKQAIEKLPKEWEAWLLLMLNCGFTQSDLDSLTHGMIKLDEGRIVRRRNKTKRNPNPPLVNYKLWDRTLTALQKVMTQPDGPKTIALLSERGKRLAPRETKTMKDGSLRTVIYDNVSRGWLKKRQNIEDLPDKQLKGLRKTGSETLKQDLRYRELRHVYLGHASSLADKHYDSKSGKPYPPFDEAILWLGAQFNFK